MQNHVDGFNEPDRNLYAFGDRSQTTFQSSTFLNLCFIFDRKDNPKQRCEA